ncbi:MAG: glycosyltransferase family 2 protein [Dorea sp.]|jgi:glycosyltransferase involved in cell wall biosynthesis|nr:glycosyltransferase family 2 protein [Dorea sp.]MCI9453995.1 glycosyltransferase family 2 protein [Dorea sp.]
MEEHLVSVVIPSYNRCDRIMRAVQSVLSQTYLNLEVIIVDDGSNDNTDELVNSIDDDRVKYIKLHSNGGACHARNVGISESKGDYIAFQDSDDFWHPDKLEKQVKTLIKTGADVLGCSYEQYLEDGRVFVKTVPNDIESGFCKVDQVAGNALFGTPTIIAKADIIKANLFDESLPRFQDFELILRLIQKNRIYFLNDSLVDAYVQNNSITQNYAKLIQAEEIILSKHAEVIEKYSSQKALHLRRLIRAKTMESVSCKNECKLLFQTDRHLKSLTVCALHKIGLLSFYYNYLDKYNNNMSGGRK